MFCIYVQYSLNNNNFLVWDQLIWLELIKFNKVFILCAYGYLIWCNTTSSFLRLHQVREARVKFTIILPILTS